MASKFCPVQLFSQVITLLCHLLITSLARKVRSSKVSWNLPTYPFPKLTLTVTSRLRQNCDLGEGKMVSYGETSIDPGKMYLWTLGFLHIINFLCRLELQVLCL